MDSGRGLKMLNALRALEKCSQSSGSEDNATKELALEEEEPTWTGLSMALRVFLPLAGLAILWSQKEVFSKLFMQLDRNCISVFCPSLSKREKLLKWASGRLPLTWSSQAGTLSSGISELWKDGSLLCTLINTVVPGACPNPHRHWRKPPLHAQALAYKYLGLPPVFTLTDFSREFSTSQERDFLYYLNELQQAIARWPTQDETNRTFSSRYVARGMGLYTGDQCCKAVFYIYPNIPAKRRDDVLMIIRGPYGTRGKASIPTFHNLKIIPAINVLHDQIETTKFQFNCNEKKSFLRNISLDFTSFIGSMDQRNEDNDIPIQIDIEKNRVKVTYIPRYGGMYEINLVSDGELLKGSPYYVHVTDNISVDNGAGEIAKQKKTEDKVTYTTRKVVSKVIDCINEKISVSNDKPSCPFGDKYNSSERNKEIMITAIAKRCDEIVKTEVNLALDGPESNKVVLSKLEDTTTTNQPPDLPLQEINFEGHSFNMSTVSSESLQASCISQEKTKNTVQIPLQKKFIEILDEVENETKKFLQQNIIETVKVKSENRSHNKEGLITALQNFITGSKCENETNIHVHQEYDENNKFPLAQPRQKITNRAFLEIVPVFEYKSAPQQFPEGIISIENITSPICPNHIVPEVEPILELTAESRNFRQLPVSERRKQFASTKSSAKLSDSQNCSFSTPENEKGSSNKESNKSNNFRELSVLNIVNSIKRPHKRHYSEPFPLSNTVSLPNIISLDTNYEQIFRAKKAYWETISSQSSSSASLTNSDIGNYRSKKGYISNKNVFNSDNFKEKQYSKYDQGSIGRISQPRTDFISTKNVTISSEAKNHKSLDDCLDSCMILSIEERKRILLKSNYEKEKLNRKKETHSTVELNNGLQYKSSAILERRSKLDKETNADDLSQKHVILAQPSEMKRNEATQDDQQPKKSAKETFKSQFKKAIKYFKNLEQSARHRSTKDKRRYSLDFPTKSNVKKPRGGSLNLPNISKRFSINNLYEDVLGNRRNSFKGTPNKSAVVDSLASFPKDENTTNGKEQQDESIQFNLFVNKSKAKVRRSIKSVFDVNY